MACSPAGATDMALISGDMGVTSPDLNVLQKFGIWIEPEMVNEDSNLYREHPDWAIRIPEKLPVRSRNQLLLIIHSYGPGNMIGSCHVEVNAADNFVAIHELVDKIERSISQQLGVMMTIHMDPVDTDDVRVAECKSMINDIISGIDSCLHIHDFRIVSGEMHTNLIFDLVVPFDYRYTYEEIKNMVDAKLFEKSHQYFTVITFDADYS